MKNMLKIGMLVIAGLIGQTVRAPVAGIYTSAEEIQYHSPADAFASITVLSADTAVPLEERIEGLVTTVNQLTDALAWTEAERRAIHSTGHSTATTYGAHGIPTATLYTTITTYELVREGDVTWTDADIQSVIDFAQQMRNELTEELNG